MRAYRRACHVPSKVQCKHMTELSHIVHLRRQKMSQCKHAQYYPLYSLKMQGFCNLFSLSYTLLQKNLLEAQGTLRRLKELSDNLNKLPPPDCTRSTCVAVSHICQSETGTGGQEKPLICIAASVALKASSCEVLEDSK